MIPLDPQSPRIGITVDNKDNTAASGKYEAAIVYGRAVVTAGGTPLLLPHEIDCVADYVDLCDGFIFTGGVDPDVRPFNQMLHPKARIMDPTRQAFELALLAALHAPRNETPALGVCLGMQLMALYAGGSLDQYMPDTLGEEAAAIHKGNKQHTLVFDASWSKFGDAVPDGVQVISHHQQAVADAGSLRIIARAPDGVIEAINDPARQFYVGVQWHPERGDDSPVNRGLIARLVEACRTAAS